MYSDAAATGGSGGQLVPGDGAAGTPRGGR